MPTIPATRLPPFHGNQCPAPGALVNDVDVFVCEFDFRNRDTITSLYFLMPNGTLIQIDVVLSLTVAEIKSELWDKARDYPLYGLLKDPSEYHFHVIKPRGLPNAVASPTGGYEILYEDITLREIDPYVCFVKVVERKGDDKEKRLDQDISKLIGKNISEFSALKNPEVNEFRAKMRNLCDDAMKERLNWSWEQKVNYVYPCSISNDTCLPVYLAKENGSDQPFLVSVKFAFSVGKVEPTFTLRVDNNILPSQLLEQALNKLPLESSKFEEQQAMRKNNFVFKCVGREEYLVKEIPLFRYLCVQEHIAKYKFLVSIPLLVCKKMSIDLYTEEKLFPSVIESSRNSFSTLHKKKSVNIVSSWEIEDNYRIELDTISRLFCTQGNSSVKVVGGLYHGTVPLCGKQSTSLYEVLKDTASIRDCMEFDIAVRELPRSARLCLAVYEAASPQVVQQRKKNQAVQPQEEARGVAWVNISVFDYCRKLRRGAMTLYCWPSDDLSHSSDLPKPLGTVVSNPDHHKAIAISIKFWRFHQSHEVMYPNKEILLDFANEHSPKNSLEFMQVTQNDTELIEKVASTPTALRDPRLEICIQDQKILWSLRWYCARNYNSENASIKNATKSILPRLLECVDWNNRLQVAQVVQLLEEWPKLEPTDSLELLDYNFAEPFVRDYAVNCITELSDDDLLLYLLQLTQALKHENHLHCSLAEFLLGRALNNTKIGHHLFWHLRAEMSCVSVCIRFGLLLEAYCRGARQHMASLSKQLDALNAFSLLHYNLDDTRQRSARGNDILRLVNDLDLELSLNGFHNLLDPTLKLSKLNGKECKQMNSKMAPLLFDFQTEDSENVKLLYKKGDDLRQDMLTLQIIHIMDKLWKKEGFDFRMTPYGCMSTDSIGFVGLIHCVPDATTIANIHRDRGAGVTSPFKKDSLLEWLRKKNNSDDALNKAVNEFTLSCAGYCVATYVLGVADRHSDNIMIKNNGQLFHIDFGHILGHFKEKFGIKREHQPFVLTHDIIYVITKGSKDTKDSLFEKFRKYCDEAYLILRRNGSFLLSLFAMMLSTGLPELQDEKDLDYINERLQLGLSDEEALQHFHQEFQEAMKNTWKTTLNWGIHILAKDKG